MMSKVDGIGPVLTRESIRRKCSIRMSLRWEAFCPFLYLRINIESKDAQV